MPRPASPLGALIESALAARFARYRDPVQYLATFRTNTGTVFAIERVTLSHINMWVPDTAASKHAAAISGLNVNRTVPWPSGRSGKYGRISSLKSISHLADEPLLRIQVTTAGDALRVAEALA